MNRHIMFNNYHCASCRHCNKDSNYFAHACTARFYTVNDMHYCAFSPDETRQARVVYDGNSAFLMCSSACRARVHYCADDNEYHYDAVYNYSDDEYVTPQYAERALWHCPECDCYFRERDFYHRYGVCRSCASNYSIIRGWHDSKGEFHTVFTDADTLRDRMLTLGFEWEIDRYHYEHGLNDETACYIDRHYPNRFVFENDCSLDYGYEIITHPHTLRALRELDIESIAEYLESYEYVSHDKGTCGLHVHFSTNFLGDYEDTRRESLYNVIMFYEYNFEYMLELSRRERYRGYADMNSRENCFDLSDDIDSVIDDNIDGSRYVAVNCTNFYRGSESTIEFRLGRGTLDADTLRAWIDIHLAILSYCHTDNCPDVTDFRGILPFCTARALEYINDNLDI